MQPRTSLTTPEKYDVLGKLAWLWMNSPLHRNWQVNLLSGFALPPIELGQYLLLERDGLPVAYCSWAHLSSQAEVAYMLNASHIALADWNGGDHLWFVDWVAPFGKADSWELKRQLAEKFPTSVARAIRVKRDSGKARVMEFRGPQTDRLAARETLTRHFQDFIKTLEAQKVEKAEQAQKAQKTQRAEKTQTASRPAEASA
jgi:cytolysin-activating lysine-acyltransferase